MKARLLILLFLLAGCGEPPQSEPARPAFRSIALSRGESMLPTFDKVEAVTLELCRFSDLRALDTVIFWHDGTQQFVHHRLIHRDSTDGRWVTAGDNNPGHDTGRMTSDEFVGRTHKLTL